MATLEKYTARLLAEFTDDELRREFGNVQRAIAFTSYIRTLLDDSTAAAARTTLGLGTAAVEAYTEGTFTPALAFGGATTGITYSLQAGGYEKIGKFVRVTIRLTLTNNGTATGFATITGMPFTVWNNNAGPATGAVYYTNLSGLTDGVVLSLNANATTGNLYFGGAASMTPLTEANITDTADMIATVCYRSA